MARLPLLFRIRFSRMRHFNRALLGHSCRAPKRMGLFLASSGSPKPLDDKVETSVEATEDLGFALPNSLPTRSKMGTKLVAMEHFEYPPRMGARKAS